MRAIALRTSSISILQTAVGFIRAGAAMVSGLAHTGDRRERTIEHADDCPQLDARRGLGQRITAKLAPLGFDITGEAQLSEDLFEKLNGKFFLQRQFAYLQDRSTQFPGDAEIDQGAESVFAAFGEVHTLLNCWSCRR